MLRRLKISPRWFFSLLVFSLLLVGLGGGNSGAQTPSTYGGVGILLDHDPKDPQKILIYSVTYKSPADKAKIKRGDRLLKVEGMDVTGHSLQELAEKIRGPLGTTVTLTVEFQGGGAQDIPLVRSEIPTGPLISVPPPTIRSTGVFFTPEEKELVKQKIMGLKTDEQRENMLNLLKALKEKKITKAQFLKFLKTDY